MFKGKSADMIVDRPKMGFKGKMFVFWFHTNFHKLMFGKYVRIHLCENRPLENIWLHVIQMWI